MSALWARFPVPVIPAPGDPAPSAPSLRVLEDLPRRVRVSDSHQTGFIAGGVLLAVAGSLTLVAPAGCFAVGVVRGRRRRARLRRCGPGCGTPRRARRGCSASHTWSTLALAVVFLADGRYVAAWWALIGLAVLTVVWAIVALNPGVASPDTYSLPMRRLADSWPRLSTPR